MIIGSFQSQRSQDRLKGFASPVHIACVQGSRGGFQGFEIDPLGRTRFDQGLDLLTDFVVEARLDPPFLTASAVWVGSRESP